jgi:hypothetical protein
MNVLKKLDFMSRHNDVADRLLVNQHQITVLENKLHAAHDHIIAIKEQLRTEQNKFRKNPRPILISATQDKPLNGLDAMLTWVDTPATCDVNKVLYELFQWNRPLQHRVRCGHTFVLEIKRLIDGEVIKRLNLIRMEKDDVYDAENERAYEFYLWVGRNANSLPIARIPEMDLGGMSFTATVAMTPEN